MLEQLLVVKLASELCFTSMQIFFFILHCTFTKYSFAKIIIIIKYVTQPLTTQQGHTVWVYSLIPGILTIYPIDAVKTRLQNRKTTGGADGMIYTGYKKFVLKVIKQHSWRALYKLLKSCWTGWFCKCQITVTNNYQQYYFRLYKDYPSGNISKLIITEDFISY